MSMKLLMPVGAVGAADIISACVVEEWACFGVLTDGAVEVCKVEHVGGTAEGLATGAEKGLAGV